MSASSRPNTTPTKELKSNSLSEMLRHKNLREDLFEQKVDFTFRDTLALHVKFAFQNIYQVPYPENDATPEKKEGANEHFETEGIARFFHGIQHVTRAMFYAHALINLYRKHGDKESLSLTIDDIRLMKIAILYHDSAREGDGEDLWDEESALFLFYYLTKTLKLSNAVGQLFAEAVANKDLHNEGYYRLVLDEKEETHWEILPPPHPPKNIFQKIIHDADCLDIIRARAKFDASYLDFFQTIVVCDNEDKAKNSHYPYLQTDHCDDFKCNLNKSALLDMVKLIGECRSLIDVQGDTFSRSNPSIKKTYENAHAFFRVYNSLINSQKNPWCEAYQFLQVNRQFIAADARLKKENSLEQIFQNAFWNNELDARGIIFPSALRNKSSRPKETFARLEIYKLLRREGILTRTFKSNAAKKFGNLNRSVSRLGPNIGIFANAGGLILGNKYPNILKISSVDCDSSFNKKTKFSASPLTEKETEQQLQALQCRAWLGGDARSFSTMNGVYTHSELVLKRITHFDAIYFSPDPTCANQIGHSTGEVFHTNAPLLQAVFILNEYTRQSGIELPLFMYSGVHHTLKFYPTPNHDEIMAAWTEMIDDFFKKQIVYAQQDPLWFLRSARWTADIIKTFAMYNTNQVWIAKKIGPADSNYPIYLQKQLNKIALQKRNFYISTFKKHFANKAEYFLSQKDLIPQQFFHLIFHPKAMNNIFIQQKILNYIHELISNPEWIELSIIGLSDENIDLKTILNDFDNLIPESLVFEYGFFCLYRLAMELGFIEEIIKLRDQAAEVIISNIRNDFTNRLLKTKDHQQFTKNLCFVVNFEKYIPHIFILQLDQNKKFVGFFKKIIFENLSRLNNVFSNDVDYRNLKLINSLDVLRTLQDNLSLAYDLKILNDHLIQIAKKIISHYEVSTELLEFNEKFHFVYLNLVDQFNLSTYQTKKKVLLNFFNFYKEKISCELMQQVGESFLKDNEIFRAILKCLTQIKNLPLPIYYFCNILHKVGVVLNVKKFSPDKIKLIKDVLKNLTIDLLNKLRALANGNDKTFMEMIGEVNNIMVNVQLLEIDFYPPLLQQCARLIDGLSKTALPPALDEKIQTLIESTPAEHQHIIKDPYEKICNQIKSALLNCCLWKKNNNNCVVTPADQFAPPTKTPN